MRVIYYDHTTKLPHGNARPCATLGELLRESDIVTLHVPETPETVGMIGAAEIAQMKPGSILINNARGTLVDLEAVAAALQSGHLMGAAADVFPEEPARNGEPFATPLQGLPNVILTPHIGGSTAEAQSRIGQEVARKLVDFSDTGATMGAVNFPQVQLPARATGARWIHVHRDAPGVLSRINESFGRRGLNIAAQYYQTKADLGLRGGRERRGAGCGGGDPRRAAGAAGDDPGAADLRAGVGGAVICGLIQIIYFR